MNVARRLSAAAVLGGALLVNACTDAVQGPVAPSLNTGPSAVASPVIGEEQIYLIDNNALTGQGDDFNGSVIYRVDLSSGTQADLTLLVDLTGNCVGTVDCNVSFDQAHIGATPDGHRVYAVNRRHVGGVNPVGYYDRALGTFVYVGEIAGLPEDGTVLVGFSPNYELFAANQDSDLLYQIDPVTLAIVNQWPLGTGGGGTLDLLGADIAFAADGTLYLWTNANGEGLYSIEFLGGSAVATRLGVGTFPFVTGLAIREAGVGDLVGSSSETDILYTINKSTGALGATFPLMLGGAAFDHTAGDMTAGLLFIPDGQGCTPGYWKQNHHFDSWVGYAPGDQFSSVFEDAFPGMTLVEVLGQGGGGLNALGRHTVAALLNSSSSVAYGMTSQQVIDAFNAAFPGGDYDALKGTFEGRNERGCPLN